MNRTAVLRIAGVLAVSFVLRPPLAGVGPIIDDIREAVGLSAAGVSLLTAVPVLCFGLGAFAGPWLERRLGMDATVLLVLLVVTAGLAVRVAGGSTVLFAGTVAVGAAVAVANVLLPAIVKADFPDRVGVMTGVYTSTLSASAALAALVAVPLLTWTDSWRWSLGVWALAGALAVAGWLPQHLTRAHRPVSLETLHPAGALLRNGTALGLTGFFGMQSLGFYATLTWLPSLLQDAGYSATTAGALLSLATVIGIPVGLVLPAFAGRAGDQRLYAVGVTALTAAGLLGLLVAPATATIVWIVLLGVGQGASFPLVLLLIVLRSSTATITGQISAMAQGIGYLVAAAGPFVVGTLYEAQDGWSGPLVFLLGCTGAQAVAGWFAGRAGVAA